MTGRRGVLCVLLALVARADAQRPVAPGWEVRIPERVDLAAGEPGVLPIAIAVDRGLVVSRDAPVIVDLASPGLPLKKPRLGRADAVDPEADAPRFAVPLRPAGAGEYVVKIHVKLWLCGGKVCRPLEVRRQVQIVVASARGSIDAGVDGAPPPDAAPRRRAPRR